MSTMLGVFSAPGAAFRKLKEKPVWVAAFIIYLVVSLAVSYIAISKIDTSDVRARIEETMRSRGATEEQIQQQTDQSLAQIRGEAVDLSLMIASKLIQRNLSKEDNDTLIEDALKQIQSPHA